jgi:Zn-dependent peptidase ImmA (M78 family)
MISERQARQFASQHFPEAPEAIAKHLGVIVRESPMGGCDGWCLTADAKTIIRLNSNLQPRRRRFTLAHELGHLILGVPTVVGESFEDMLRSDSKEERRVNDLASALLLPSEQVKAFLPSPPVVADSLRKLARKANVSELAAAIRVCNLAQAIGLVNASVVLFNKEQIRWQWSKSLSVAIDTAGWLLTEARKAAPGAVRRAWTGGDVIIASIIENRLFGTAALFVQVLPAQLGMNLSPHERRIQLEHFFFQNDTELRNQVSGFFGYYKSNRSAKTMAEAVVEFWKRYGDKLKNTPLDSAVGREYVNLRLSEWF